MHRTLWGAMILLAATATQAAELDVGSCRFPEPPTIPEGAKATETQMGEAGAAVRDFVSGIQTSLQCLSSVEASMGEEITEEQQAQLIAIYNNGVDQMNTVAENYNEQVRAFKGR